MRGLHGDGRWAYRELLPVPGDRAQGKSVVTVEGLAGDSGLHPIQEAFLQHGAASAATARRASWSAAAVLGANRHPSEQEVKRALAGNICRCTGYVNIIRALQAAMQVRTSDEREAGRR